MTDHLKGKVALVTGASRGIGAAAARLFAEAGAATVLTARRETEIEALAAEIRAAGGRAAAVACDVADPQAVEAAMAHAAETFGGLDILVNNAGMITPVARMEEISPAEWGRVIDVNLKGVFNGLSAALPLMRARGGGVIVNISSGAVNNPVDRWSHYCASKAGAQMLTRCAGLELEGGAIRVIGLDPGTVATGMLDTVARAAEVNPVAYLDSSAQIPPEWAARAILWATGPDAAAYHGRDIRLEDEATRRRIGLI
ncbi:MAG: SDR family oxidoreductase [Pikeienuella sp.]